MSGKKGKKGLILFVLAFILGVVLLLIGWSGTASCDGGDACAEVKPNTEESCATLEGCNWSKQKAYSKPLKILGAVIIACTLLACMAAGSVAMASLHCDGRARDNCMAPRCTWDNSKIKCVDNY